MKYCLSSVQLRRSVRVLLKWTPFCIVAFWLMRRLRHLLHKELSLRRLSWMETEVYTLDLVDFAF